MSKNVFGAVAGKMIKAIACFVYFITVLICILILILGVASANLFLVIGSIFVGLIGVMISVIIYGVGSHVEKIENLGSVEIKTHPQEENKKSD